jgi:hypothetical protein
VTVARVSRATVCSVGCRAQVPKRILIDSTFTFEPLDDDAAPSVVACSTTVPAISTFSQILSSAVQTSDF